MRQKLNAGNYEDVPPELNRWVKATDPASGKKKTLRGLVRRRAAEGDLWLTPDEPAGTQEADLSMPQLVCNVDTIADTSAPTLAMVTEAMGKLGYKIYDGIDASGGKRNYDLNIFGVRSENTSPGAFDDWLGVLMAQG
ncbi:MAG: hypothetical protein MI799_17345 [Desulfobacterales bacterium]|nr:hypothetical protein [Desulfobacterales bacterium]